MSHNYNELNSKLNELQQSWQQFKDVNNSRLEQIEKKNHVDPLTKNHLDKINNSIDDTKDKIQKIENAINREQLLNEIQNNEEVKEYKSNLFKFIKSGNSSNKYEYKSSLNAQDNSYLSHSNLDNAINKALKNNNIIRHLSDIQIISGDSLEVVQDNGEFSANWSGIDTNSVSNTNISNLQHKVIQAHELYAQPKITSRLLDDSNFNLDQWITEKIYDVFMKLENNAFLLGNGTTQPRGILTYNDIDKIDSGIDASLDANSIIKLYYSLDNKYLNNASFIMDKSVLQAVRISQDNISKQYLWQPASKSQQETLLGVPVYTMSDMPIASSGSLSVIIGDFKAGYKIVEKDRINIMRDPFTEKPFVKFYTTKRVGGDVINYDAFKILKLSV